MSVPSFMCHTSKNKNRNHLTDEVKNLGVESRYIVTTICSIQENQRKKMSPMLLANVFISKGTDGNQLFLLEISI